MTRIVRWLRDFRYCKACGQPSRLGNRLVRADGYRVHRSCTTHPASGFAKAVAV